MKYLIVILLTLASVNSFAEDVNKDKGVINGNNNVTNICQPKVIINTCKECNTCKIKPKTVYKTKIKYVKVKPVIITKTIIKKQKVEVKRKMLKNAIRILGGHGPNGVSAHVNGSSAVATQDEGLVLGLGYSRLLSEDFSVELDALNNDTYLLGIGFHF